MERLPIWAWWVVIIGLLLSPVFAFLAALLFEIFIAVLKEGGLAAVVALLVAGLIGGLWLRKLRMRPELSDIVEDQA